MPQKAKPIPRKPRWFPKAGNPARASRPTAAARRLGGNFRQQRDNRDGNRERFRPRWQNRGDQPRDGDSEPRPAEPEPQMAREAAVESRPKGNVEEAGSGQWEAPSFLRRPAPVEVMDEPVADKKARSPRRAQGRKQRRTGIKFRTSLDGGTDRSHIRSMGRF